jgi:rod shape-determining protein MreC
MEALLARYRNLVVLMLVVVSQLLYLAYQWKTGRDERLIRVWAVSAVTPMAGIVEAVRHNTIGFMEDYFILLDVRDQNRRLKAENDRLRMDNIYYRNQLTTAEHARALKMFQSQTESKTVAARVIGNSTVASAKAVFIDRGSTSGIGKGMAVVTPDGIIGKVVAVYPLVAQVLLVTDPTFKVGVESQKGHVHGVLNCGAGHCVVEQIQNGDKVDVSEWFFTSGEDRIFPKGFPVGMVISVALGTDMKDVKLNLSGAPGGVEEVLVVLQGVHQAIPLDQITDNSTFEKPLPPPPSEKENPAAKPGVMQTDADKLKQQYQKLGQEQGHVYGGYASALPDFSGKPVVKPTVPVAKPENKSPLGSPALSANQSPNQAADQVAKPPVNSPPPAKPAPKPVLPLGAPRPPAPAHPPQ